MTIYFESTTDFIVVTSNNDRHLHGLSSCQVPCSERPVPLMDASDACERVLYIRNQFASLAPPDQLGHRWDVRREIN